jgi:UPF0755 protein
MKKRIAIVVGVLLLALGFYMVRTYVRFTGANVATHLPDPILTIPTGSTFDVVVDSLVSGGFLKNESSFRELAGLKGFGDDEVRPGMYHIKAGWSNRHLLNHLLAGPQAEVRMVLNGARLPEDVAARAARYLEIDSTDILTLITNAEVLGKYGIEPIELMCTFIPNSYHFFWTTSAEGFLKRMIRERDNFWSRENRRGNAERIGLTPCEVMTLASIVEKETLVSSERPKVAGLYINRLKKGMRLQADPTAVFATRDFAARRVLNRHISFDSPYNTYLYPGLPPGPICMPSIQSIDAVLNAEQHDYLFMCAKPGNSGLHAFAKNHRAHSRNAAKYRAWLNSQGIR